MNLNYDHRQDHRKTFSGIVLTSSSTAVQQEAERLSRYFLSVYDGSRRVDSLPLFFDEILRRSGIQVDFGTPLSQYTLSLEDIRGSQVLNGDFPLAPRCNSLIWSMIMIDLIGRVVKFL
jgi:hypothetical protein